MVIDMLFKKQTAFILLLGFYFHNLISFAQGYEKYYQKKKELEATIISCEQFFVLKNSSQELMNWFHQDKLNQDLACIGIGQNSITYKYFDVLERVQKLENIPEFKTFIIDFLKTNNANPYLLPNHLRELSGVTYDDEVLKAQKTINTVLAATLNPSEMPHAYRTPTLYLDKKWEEYGMGWALVTYTNTANQIYSHVFIKCIAFDSVGRKIDLGHAFPLTDNIIPGYKDTVKVGINLHGEKLGKIECEAQEE